MKVVEPQPPVAHEQAGSLRAAIGRLAGFDDRPVAWFRGAVATSTAPIVARLVRTAVDNGVPVVGVVEQLGLDAGAGLLALEGLGTLAHELSAASGVVP